MFGSTFGQSQPAGGGLFGSTNTAQPSGGLFGSTNTAQKPGGLFGSTTTTGAQNQGGGLFGGAGQNTQQNQQQASGLFGGGLGASTQQNQPQAGGLFGANAQQPQQQQTGGLFSGQTMGAQQQAAQQQQQQQQTGLFGQTQSSQALGQSQGQFGNSLFTNTNTNGLRPREKSVIDQIETVVGKWDTGSKDCAFQYFFYNNVGVDEAPFYQPQPNEDPRAWEEALSKKPGPGYIPVSCIGFQMMGDRIKAQQNHLAAFNIRLHNINASLSNLLQNHDTRTSIRAMDARRKHVVLKQRCIALATKVQVLRNRGYALNRKGASDPALGARAEEIWARMINVQERGRLLRTELEKVGQENGEILDDTMTARCKKILEDYQTQLAHLKKELDRVHKDYVEWEKEQPPQIAARTRFGR
ncbi:nucleoporin nup44 [Botrytis cinerea]